MTKKTTPSNCRFQKCHWNALPPGEESQECIACEGNKKADWRPSWPGRGTKTTAGPFIPGATPEYTALHGEPQRFIRSEGY